MDCLSVNLVLRSDEGITVRVLWIDAALAECWLIDVDDTKSVMPFRNPTRELIHATSARLFVVVDDPWLTTIRCKDLTAKQQARQQAAWAVIQPLVEDEPAIFEPEWRAQLVGDAVARTGVSRNSIYRHLRRWWQRGMTPSALATDYDRCGGAGKIRSISTAIRGRPSANKQLSVNVSEDLRLAMRDAVTKYVANKKMNVSGCYREFLRMHSSTVTRKEGGSADYKLDDQIPSEVQFRYWLKKDNDIFLMDRIRRTPRVYDQTRRGMLGSASSEVYGPGARYIIDATIANLYLASRFSMTAIVGRPVIYVVIDVFSRMIVGLHVSLEAPSWVGAMCALANVATDKVAYARRFGVEIEEFEWPCREMPRKLLADKGELYSKYADGLPERLNITVENAASWRPDWKGVVESRFRLLDIPLKTYSPGYVEPDFQERGARDYRLDAKLTLEDFTRLMIRIVHYYNNKHNIADFHLEPEMVLDGVAPIPVEVWEWGIARRSGRLVAFPEDFVKLCLLPRETATVTEYGVRFEGCYYSSEALVARHWLEKARRHGTWRVEISFDPFSLNQIWLRNFDLGNEFHVCSLTQRSSSYEDASLWEIQQIRANEKETLASRKRAQLEARMGLDDFVEQVSKDARGKPTPDHRSKAERLSDIRGNRARERDANRKPFVQSSDPAPPRPRDNYDSDDDFGLPDLRQIREGTGNSKSGGGDGTH